MLGIDLLGGAKYRSTAVAGYGSLHGYAAGMFWKQFGEAGDLIRGLLKAGCRTFRIHLLWDYSHRYASSNLHDAAVDEFVKCLKCFHGSHGGQLYISPFCEHLLPAQTVAAVIKRCWAKLQTAELHGCPIPIFVNSADPSSAVTLGNLFDEGTKKQITVINEIHVPQGTPNDKVALIRKPGGTYTVSPDGWDLTSEGAVSFNRHFSDALIRFAWDQSLNLHPKAPTTQHIAALGALLKKTA